MTTRGKERGEFWLSGEVVRGVPGKNLHGAIKKKLALVFTFCYIIKQVNLFQERGVPILWLALLKAN